MYVYYIVLQLLCIKYDVLEIQNIYGFVDILLIYKIYTKLKQKNLDIWSSYHKRASWIWGVLRWYCLHWDYVHNVCNHWMQDVCDSIYMKNIYLLYEM